MMQDRLIAARRSGEMVQKYGNNFDRTRHQALVWEKSYQAGVPGGHGLEGNELFGVGRQCAAKQIFAKGHVGEGPAVEGIVGRVRVPDTIAAVGCSLCKRIAIDQCNGRAAARQ